jgi:hypothetical protein
MPCRRFLRPRTPGRRRRRRGSGSGLAAAAQQPADQQHRWQPDRREDGGHDQQVDQLLAQRHQLAQCIGEDLERAPATLLDDRLAAHRLQLGRDRRHRRTLAQVLHPAGDHLDLPLDIGEGVVDVQGVLDAIGALEQVEQARPRRLEIAQPRLEVDVLLGHVLPANRARDHA